MRGLAEVYQDTAIQGSAHQTGWNYSSLDQLALEDVPQRNPRKETLQSQQRSVQQRRPLTAVEYKLAELVDFGEFLEKGVKYPNKKATKKSTGIQMYNA